RGGWTWYTGSAGWMYQLITESFLGLKRKSNSLSFAPCIPSEWPSVKIHYRYMDTMYHIEFVQSHPGSTRTTTKVLVDGVEENSRAIFLQNDGKPHEVKIFIEKMNEVKKTGLL
ncbi:MAG TPA: glycosyl hydrolase family 65 protein, partial [Chitinophagaceae bacterium]|nr:glycosyl hydrolase family 65 protein [Chitinophagaceae bacterium]